MKALLLNNRAAGYALAVLSLLASTGMKAQNGNAGPPALSATQIVEQVQQHNEARKAGLRHYQALRHYEVEYRGYFRVLAARMDVEVTYDASSGKKFRIVSQSGSKRLCEKVLKRAIESEYDAAQNRSEAAISELNYRFYLNGVENVTDRSEYVLNLEPLHKNKFLLRGKIWVDAIDFAVTRIEAEPAKNPSFWISRTLIHHRNAKTGDFWLPKQLRSESKVRVGGTAIMTIDYGTYQIASENLRAVVMR